MNPGFDAKDAEILAARLVARANLNGPLVGDFVYIDGVLRRFTHDWEDDIQTTTPNGEGSFYLSVSGHMSYSGSLDPSVPKAKLRKLNMTLNGRCWFFHHDELRAHNAVFAEVGCSVYELSRE